MRSMLDSIQKRFLLIVVMALFCVSLTASAVTTVPSLPSMDGVRIWVVLAILIWEYLVGKTKIVKSNSTIELVESFIKKIFGITSDDLKVG